MAEAPVIDASPIIYLSRTGDLDLLAVRGERILVPVPVAEEIRAKGADDPAVEALGASPFLHVVEPPPPPDKLRSWELGRGETAVLAWASSYPGTIAIIDDLEARRCARALAVPCIGTLGILLQAKRQGLIRAARPVVERLIGSGMYLSDRVVNTALALVDE